MRTIEITDGDYERLQKAAIPFVDTPATVIARLLDQYETLKENSQPVEIVKQKACLEYRSSNMPSLVHTKLMEARFAGERPLRMTWDSLMRLALEKVFSCSSSVTELRRLSGVNAVEGRKEDEGYKHIHTHDFSYQGVSAQDAVQIIIRCAKVLECDVEFEFEWRNKEGAANPGERAIVRL